jgi:predicted nucleotide-binding protein
LTDLGRRIVAPLEEGDDATARRQAVLTPTVIRKFLERYDGSPLPAEKIAFNVLESMDVPADRTKGVFDLIVANADAVGYLKRIKDKTYVDLGAVGTIAVSPQHDDTPETLTDDGDPVTSPDLGRTPAPSQPPAVGQHPKAIFLGHGKNRKPLEQLVKILDEYGIPHKEAIAEPNAGRPIPAKVADTMKSCGAAILIFTADEVLRDEVGSVFWRPSENVAHELGAASVLYDNRIIIFKEDGVSLASNFSSIGYISFEKDKLSDKGIELFRELVNFKIVSITVGG